MDMAKFQYYQLEKKHIPDVQYICRKSFGKKFTKDHLQHKYNSSYLDIPPIATIAYDGQKPIAFYGGVPQLFESNEQSFLIVHTCDSYTLPKYQKKGIHRNLALKAYDAMQRYDVKMVYAFHSENTYHSTKKLGWKEHVNMRRFHIKTNALPISKIAVKLNAQKWIINKAEKVLKPYLTEVSSNPLKQENKICNNYSKNFYRYKEGLCRHFSIQIESCQFYLKISSVMQIGFLNYPDLHRLKDAISTLKELAYKIQVPEILFQIDPSTRAYKDLKSIDQDYPSWLVGYLCFDADIKVEEFGFNYGDLDTF